MATEGKQGQGRASRGRVLYTRGMSELAISSLRMDQCEAASRVVVTNPIWTDRYRYPAERAAADLTEAIGRGDLVLGASDASGLIGFAWVLPRGAFGRFPYLRLLAVDAKAHGSGAGRALLEKAEEMMRPARQMLLMVSDFNDGAQRFYRRQGYARVGSCPDFLVDGIAEQLWLKRL